MSENIFFKIVSFGSGLKTCMFRPGIEKKIDHGGKP